jgi:23S rRNA (guanosine2251-2'-O)-methyltransferase
MTDLLYGRQAVRETLRARRRRYKRLWLLTGAKDSGLPGEIAELAADQHVPVERVDRRQLDRQFPHANHQGVVLQTGSYPYVELDDCLQLAEQRHQMPFLLLLDHLQDPQNIGTLLRTAEAVGVHGVLLPGRRSAEITPAVVNASSGASEHLYISIVGNLANTITTLQNEGLWVIGLEQAPQAQPFDQADLNIPLALVVGAEGKGLARLTGERCDDVLYLPMCGQVASLNAAVAGSIALYHAWRQRTHSIT